jgi:hypothetical protein
MVFYKFFKITLISLLLPCAQVFGQFNPIRQAEKKMTQGNWGAAHQILAKALRKDTLNVQAEVAISRWFFHQNNPQQNIDSAYRHNLKALDDLQKLPVKEKEKLKHDRIDSLYISNLRRKIDSAAFERAKQLNTEKSYQDFIQRFVFSKDVLVAVELRDEVAYVNVLRQNSYLAFEDYLNRYPKSHRAKEAKERYDRLLFESKTKDKKLKSFLSFVKEVPSSQYRPVADKNIFELTTIGGLPTDFIKFLTDYPDNSMVNRARDILFHIARESDEKLSSTWMTDSLLKVVENSKLNWVAIYKNQKFGFMDSRGEEVFAPQFDAIKEEYKCGSIKDDVLITSNGLFSRNGVRLADKTSLVKDLGFGFLKIGDSSCVKILHKSGARIIESCAADALVIGGRFLTVKINELIALYALNGRMLMAPQWNSIEMVEGIIVLDRLGKKTLCLPDKLTEIADGGSLQEDFVFDNVKSLGNGLLLVSNGSLEGIINSNLEFVVPLARQSLYQMPFGLVRKINDQFIFTNLSPEIENTAWQHYRFYKQWLLLKNVDGQKLFDLHNKKIVEAHPDSLWVSNGLVFASVEDSVHIHVNSTSRVTLPVDSKITFIKALDSIRYFFAEHKNKKNVFSLETGEKLFSMEFDQVESLSSEVFVITKKNKKGLINKKGKPILLTEYDALVPLGENQLSLLKAKKFGLYSLVSGKLIAPDFERNISILDSETLIAFKSNHYGLINWEGKPLTAFEFDEIQPWKKNVVWVKKDFEWSLFDVSQSIELLKRVRSFTVFSEREGEKLAIVQQENYFGVLSNTRGMIIPLSFSNVTNLGNEDEPLYFTSKEVEEAGIVVVIYYDAEGKLLRKQVYEDNEYAHIVCPED